MTKIKYWSYTQWLLAVAFIFLYTIIALSPWYYNVTYSRQFREDSVNQEVDIHFTDTQGNMYDAEGNMVNEFGDIIEENSQWIPPNEIPSQEVPTVQSPQQNQLTLREKMIMELESGNETLSSNRMYRNQGRLRWSDHLFMISLVVTMFYGYGMFLSSKKTFLILISIPYTLLLVKTLFIIKSSEIYAVNVINVISWWLVLIIYTIIFYVNDKTVAFVDLDDINNTER